ncbi:MAG TPA: contractile injection system protein, VgrG/Pvc8 family, partial [Candidatus Nanopelagicales bacterium]|nr:contractile injection system protein, VgrG/Pvc8 family [Candidatus Nanopelagicales bacterium]
MQAASQNLVLYTAASEPLDVRSFTVIERISKPFEIALRVMSPSPDVDLGAIVGRPATFGIHGRMAMPPIFQAALGGDFGGVIESTLGALTSGASLEEVAQGLLTQFAEFVQQTAVRVASDFANRLVSNAIGGVLGERAGALAADVAGRAAGNLTGDLLQNVGLPRGGAPQPLLDGGLEEAVRRMAGVPTIPLPLPQGLSLPGAQGAAAPELPVSALGRIWNGVVREATQEEVEPDGLSTYALVLVPHLWLLGRRRNNRRWQRLSAPEIAVKLLEEWGIQPELKVSPEEHRPLDF